MPPKTHIEAFRDTYRGRRSELSSAVVVSKSVRPFAMPVGTSTICRFNRQGKFMIHTSNLSKKKVSRYFQG